MFSRVVAGMCDDPKCDWKYHAKMESLFIAIDV